MRVAEPAGASYTPPCGKPLRRWNEFPVNEHPAAGDPAIEAAGPKILIVDDDADFLQNLSAALSKAGFQIVTAADVDEAEPILARKRPGIDLLIIDLVLPGPVTGFDLISVVTRTTPPFKIIAASAVYRNATLEHIAHRMGADAFVEKARPGEPFNCGEWIDTVRRVLQRETGEADASL